RPPPPPPSPLFPYTTLFRSHTLSRYGQDAELALQMLVDELGAPEAAIPDPGPRPEVARGAITPDSLAQTVAALMPLMVDGRCLRSEEHTSELQSRGHLVCRL